MSSLFGVEGRIALVTGASRGLGRDMAATLAAHGAAVICAGRAAKDLAATVRLIERRGGTAEALVLDILDEEAVAAAIAGIVKRRRRLDILVNNAGIMVRQPALEMPTAEFRRVLDTNLTAQFVLAREAGRAMATRRRGRIVNVSSIMGLVGRGTVAGYVAAKHGLNGLTKTLAAELGPHVTVNAIAPGYMRTEITKALQNNSAFTAMIETRSPLRRWGEPKDLRGALMLLASDAGAFLTGHVLVVDGGLTAVLG